MARETLLLADNNADYLDTTRDLLEKAGYKVYTATAPEEAQHILSDRRVDLAILDLRLRDNKDQHDTSGLEIAKFAPPSLPKIIVSDYGNPEAVRNALSIDLNGLPPAIDFIEKKKGAGHLIAAVEKGLILADYLNRSLDRLSDKLDGFYDDARHEARLMFRLSAMSSIIGIIIILVAGIMGFFQEVATAMAPSLAAIITQGIALLFFKRADDANARRDQYHIELLRIREFEILLSACSTLKIGQEFRTRKKVIEAGTAYWFKRASNDKNDSAFKPVERGLGREDN